MGSPQPQSANGVDSDFQPRVPAIPGTKSYGGVKEIGPYEVSPLGTIGTDEPRPYGEETVAAYDDAAALQLEGSMAKLKGKLHPEPSPGVLSPGDGINALLTCSEIGTSVICDSISSSQTTPDLVSPGIVKNTVISSSEVITCSARMLPCLRCQSTNTKFWFYDISSKEPHHLCKDCSLLWNADILTMDLCPKVNHAPESNEVSIDMPSENGMVPNKPPGAETTRNISVFKGFVDAARPRLERIIGDSKIVKILIMVIAEAGFALVTYGSGANTSMMPNERILLDIAGVSSIVGFLCCLSCLLLRGVRPGGALILAGLGFIAVIIGFLALMGMLWI